MWNVKYDVDPFADASRSAKPFFLATANIDILTLFTSYQPSYYEAFREGGRPARVALADYVARIMTEQIHVSSDKFLPISMEVVHNYHSNPLWVPSCSRGVATARRPVGSKKPSTGLVPFVFERTDVWCHTNNLLYVTFRVQQHHMHNVNNTECHDVNTILDTMVHQFLNELRHQVISSIDKLMEHVSCNVLQHNMREFLHTIGAICFIADGSVLPRKTGASQQPMKSPPAIPFQAPSSTTNTEPMTRKTICVPLGLLLPYLPRNTTVHLLKTSEEGTVTMTGLLIPKGITLICGGGYHGKSTLLRTIAASVYNKIPGDGREYCVTCQNAVVVRAEDGRYVNNCNVSAFISDLPTTTSLDGRGHSNSADKNDATFYFSSSDASGSTSQAANVVEAIEMGASTLLVDEDISAANFMARDGRMRALIQDESITPLLYRVNGIYDSLGISSIVVVGGVGDWLDVPHNVLLLNKYICSDATKKARSISEQFSYGHVQYAGRGVVHRLPWPTEKAPRPRRPKQEHCNRHLEVVTVPGNDSRLFLLPTDHIESGDSITDTPMLPSTLEVDEHNGEIDMVKCDQLLGKLPQLHGCGLCVKWILQASKSNPNASTKSLLDLMENYMDENGGIRNMLLEFSSTRFVDEETAFVDACHVLSTAGFSYRPRRFEVAMALTRMRGLVFEDIPASTEEKNTAEERAMEEERKKNELMDLWQSRRNV